MKSKKYRLIFLITVLVSLSIAYLAEATDYSNNLVRYVFRQKNSIPQRRFNEPGEGQIEILKDAAHLLQHSQFAAAIRSADAAGYMVKAFTHTNNLTYYILQSTDPKRRPWGTYIFYLGADQTNTVIEVPHPVEEKNTSIIGIESFIDGKSSAFLLSGSRKGAAAGSDVTLNPNTVFQAIHEEATTTETPPVTLQIHGFNKRKYPEIILTSGTPVINQAMNKVADEFLEEEFTLGVYDGNQYSDYGATQNEQAKYTNSIGESFVGIYLNQIVHNSHDNSQKVIRAISEYCVTETASSDTSS